MEKSPRLQQLIGDSTAMIRKTERLALMYDERGFEVAFSGGKDSMVLLWLFEHSDVKFHAEMQCTTIDTPELMAFVRKYYTSTGRVTLHRPHYADGTPKNFFKELEKRGMPTRTRRWCCEQFKEFASKNKVVAVGIRQAESIRRKKQNPTPLSVKGGKDMKAGEHSIIRQIGKTNVKHIDMFDMDSDMIVECAMGGDSVRFSPIFNWEDGDVWELIRTEQLPYCKLYDEGYERIGCIMCPLSSPKTFEMHIRRYPKFFEVYKAKLNERIAKQRAEGKHPDFIDADEVFRWYKTGKSVAEWKAEQNYPRLFNK